MPCHAATHQSLLSKARSAEYVDRTSLCYVLVCIIPLWSASKRRVRARPVRKAKRNDVVVASYDTHGSMAVTDVKSLRESTGCIPYARTHALLRFAEGGEQTSGLSMAVLYLQRRVSPFRSLGVMRKCEEGVGNADGAEVRLCHRKNV